ncbi:MAG: hypothetical protein EKK57_07065 [Proteobacteria bacterium]|nr:MAG: hypothetical protein EKK57_07065 [Pseudomonadota bacterium]
MYKSYVQIVFIIIRDFVDGVREAKLSHWINSPQIKTVIENVFETSEIDEIYKHKYGAFQILIEVFELKILSKIREDLYEERSIENLLSLAGKLNKTNQNNIGSINQY